jgi:hypothetical protein
MNATQQKSPFTTRTALFLAALVGVGLLALWGAMGCSSNSAGSPNGGSAANNDTRTRPGGENGGTGSGGKAFQPDPGFTAPFDGKELTGWRQGNGPALDGKTETPERRFLIKDGTIILAAKDKDGKRGVQDLLLGREFAKDFVLKLEYRASQEAVAAVLIRGGAVAAADFIRRGERPQLKQFRNDDWNQLEITVKQVTYAQGRALTDSDTLEASFVNGKAQARLNGSPIDPNAVIVHLAVTAQCNGETLLYPFAVPSKGQIGLRADSGKVEFRNIQYRELP